jgi:cyclomaltodextrinase
MLQWAAESTYYHLVIDRFATDRNHFILKNEKQTNSNLRQWMGGNIQGITQSLDYLQQLGIGAILLTPFFKGKKYHGYWTTDFKKIDPHFGNPKQLKELIDCAHRRNIRVIMDLPITHCHRDALYAKQALTNYNSRYREWFHFKDEQEFLGFFGDSALPELNLELPELRNYLKAVTDRWLGFGFDGIRFDHAKRPSASFWNDFTGHLHQQHPQIFQLGENWHESGRIGTLSPYLHGELNIPLCKALRQFIRQPCLHTTKQITHHIEAQKSLRKQGYLLPTFLDNHDMERVSHLAQDNHPIIALGYLIQLTLPYPPIIYYGSERAQVQSNNFAKGQYERDRFFREPMHWHGGQDMANWVSSLVQYRNKYITWFMSEPVSIKLLNENIFTYSYSHKDTLITVLINYTSVQQEIVLPIIPNEKLVSSNNTIHHCNDSSIKLQLQGCSGAIINSNLNHAIKDTTLEETILTVA